VHFGVGIRSWFMYCTVRCTDLQYVYGRGGFHDFDRFFFFSCIDRSGL
jgi:hypothetical protein